MKNFGGFNSEAPSHYNDCVLSFESVKATQYNDCSFLLYNTKNGNWLKLNPVVKIVLEHLCNGSTIRETAIKLGSQKNNFLDINLSALLDDIIHALLSTGIARISNDLFSPPEWFTSTHPPLNKVYWVATNRCNLRCGFCYNSGNDYGYSPELSTKEVIELIDQLASMGVLEVIVTGGEPLLRSDILNILTYMRSKNLGVKVYTNGLLVDYNTAKFFESIGISMVQVSLHASNPYVQDRITGKKGSFIKAKEGIENLRSCNVPVTISMTCYDDNVKEVIPLGNMVRKDFPGTKFDATPVMGRLDINSKEYLQILDACAEAFLRFGDIWADKNQLTEILPPGSISSCGAGIHSCCILADGRITLCPLLNDDSKTEGNIRDQSLLAIWQNSPTFSRLRTMSLENISPCNTCISQRSCRGGCRARAYFSSGDYFTSDPVACELFKKISKIKGGGYL